MKKNRTLLVDSNYLLKQSISGNKTSYTEKFGFIGGLYTYFTILRKIIKQHQINKIIAFWDGENGGIYRYKIDRKYKANRESKKWYSKIELTDSEIEHEKKKRESLLRQKIRIQQYNEELYIRQIQVDDIEADDLISDYIIRNHQNEDIILYTNDRDFCQLLDLNFNILFGNKDVLINKNNFIMYFQYSHVNALTIKIICGDTSDNIDGVSGIQEKTLLSHFPELVFSKITVKDICKKAKLINEERINNKKKPLVSLSNLLESKERLKTNFKLMNLREPILNSEAVEALEILELPLSPEGRSSKNLYNMMIEDGFLEIYGSTFVNYIEAFYTVIMNEKEIYKNYLKNKK